MIQKKPLLIGNWKSELDVKKSVAHARALVEELQNIRNVEIAVMPSYLALANVAEVIRDTTITLGAQDVSMFENGPHTGEVSAHAIAELGVQYVIIGHSERRLEHNETDKIVAQKIQRVSEAGMVPILCVGESRKERRNKQTRTVLRRQIVKGLALLSKTAPVAVLYEPVWAIGAKEPASIKVILEAVAIIREATDHNVRVLYGGAVTQKDAPFFAAESTIDGVVMGRASLDVNQFRAIIEAYEKR